MTAPLHRLIYYSFNQIGADAAAFAGEVDDILAKSRANNARDGITGALLFNAGCFAQVLEGPQEQVEATFERIQQDERHGEVQLLALEQVTTRSFPNWAMGFVGLSDADARRFAGIGMASGFDPARFSGEQILKLLHDLTIEEEQSVA